MIVNTPNLLQDFVLKHLNTTEQVYLLSPHRMLSEYNGERENVRNYNGRQLLEMLQNADDASVAAVPGNRKVLIRLDGNLLTIANTGYPFSEEGLNSIFHSHLSPKQAQDRQIGKKGLGFRSILSWANKITIRSHGLLIAFSKDYSRRFLEKLLRDEDFKLAFKKLKHSEKYPIATLVCPNMEDAVIDSFYDMNAYDTVIQVELNDNAISEVEKQIAGDIDGEVLLFLNSLERIRIESNGVASEFSRKVISPDRIRISHFADNTQMSKEWNLHSISGNILQINKPFELSLAWQDNFQDVKNVIYSYFRTKITVQCNGIIHGSFELNADRNLIIKDDEGYNEELIRKIPELLAGAAESIARSGETVSYSPIRMLRVDLRSVNHLVDTDEIDAAIVERMKEREIFPVISGQYVNWNEDDKPAYFTDKILPTYLDPELFPDLLLHCDDKDAETFIQLLEPAQYLISSVIENIAKQRDVIPIRDYALLIIAIHANITKETELSGTSLFYDKNSSLLTFDQPIFFPGDSKYVLPSALGVQIVSPLLAEELLMQTGSSGYLDLSSRLKYFGIREYKFTEVVELLRQHYSEAANSSSMIEFHVHLFALYEAEAELEDRWKGADIRIISKTGMIKVAGELYFGKEYGNSIIEEIYNYDKSKIICNFRKFGILESKKETWNKYCEWLGVNRYPRKVMISADNRYAEYVMKSFDYKHEIGNYYFKGGYTEFKKAHTQGYGSIEVMSLDDLTGILKNNPTERILKLLSEHVGVLSYLEKDIEPDSSSMELGFYNAKYWRKVPGRQMRSYIKWVLKFSDWVQTEQGAMSHPDKCCTATYINEEFQGLIDRPKIDYDILKEANINRDKADYLLTIVGVHKSVNTFSTNTLYSMLLNLPRIDPHGKKSKSILNQLAVSYDEKLLDMIDKLDSNYLKFGSEGKIWCQAGGYYNLKEVYYVNDRRYGETILKQFNTIAIDKRRGKEKIRSLFGVRPLEGLELIIENIPEKHYLNSIFEMEMEAFKPYVYVLRKEVDSGNEKMIIKETKFQLVRNLRLKMVMDLKHVILHLDDYEYFYHKGRNIVYLKIDKNYNDILELKDDVFFCSAVAEVFSAMLDVEAQRQQIRELFSKSMVSRDELLIAELDDRNLQRLYDAKRLLGITDNPKLEFWKAFCKCVKGKKLLSADYTDEHLLGFLKFRHPELLDVLEEAFNSINYSDINEEMSLELIVILFKKAGVTVDKFNSVHYPSLDIKELYEICFKRIQDERKSFFKNSIYNSCLRGLIPRHDFLSKVHQYDLLRPNVVNEIDFNVEDDLFRQIEDKFLIDMSIAVPEYKINEIYNDNLNRILNELQSHTANRQLFEQYLEEQVAIQSLLCFVLVPSEIISVFLLWMGGRQTESSSGQLAHKSNRIRIGNRTILYNNYKELLNEADLMLNNAAIESVQVNGIETLRSNVGTSKGTGFSSSFNGGGGRFKVNNDIGFWGEYIVYRYLQLFAEPNTVQWVSQYAKDCGVNLSGKDGLGYDLQYIPKGFKNFRYVEVKVVGWENAFHMTSTEIKYGEKYKKHYDIFLVRNLDDFPEVKIEIIRRLFDYEKQASFTDNDKFTVINDNFTIKFRRRE
jgi:Protein NO VEIN, C-terminal